MSETTSESPSPLTFPAVMSKRQKVNDIYTVEVQSIATAKFEQIQKNFNGLNFNDSFTLPD